MSIFKVGDRVFHYVFKWGIITDIKENEPFSIKVNFNNDQFETFKDNGIEAIHRPPTLSFTEYTFKGFSQVRPRPDLKAGDLIWVKDQGTEWLLKRFFAWTPKGVFVKLQESSDFESAMVMEFPIYSLECPIKS